MATVRDYRFFASQYAKKARHFNWLAIRARAAGMDDFIHKYRCGYYLTLARATLDDAEILYSIED